MASDNLGMLAGLTAAGALLVDYVLTISVSIASGVAQNTPLVPDWLPYDVPIAVAAVVLIVLGNLTSSLLQTADPPRVPQSTLAGDQVSSVSGVASGR